MKWLLITNTDNWNCGDEFIRVAVQDMVREIDADARFHLINKQHPDDYETEIAFDKAIWCGSPMFWSNEENECHKNYWWEPLVNGWLFKNPKRVLALAVGHVLGTTIKDIHAYVEAIETVRKKCWALMTRSVVIDHPGILVGMCPSIFLLLDSACGVKSFQLCNLMRHGAHDPFLNPKEAELWKKMLPEIAERLKPTCSFIAHDNDEKKLASELGWTDDRIIRCRCVEDYIACYRKCSWYFGNRLHGAMITLGGGASVLAVGYDSRLEMVRYAGGAVRKPSELDRRNWIEQVTKLPDLMPIKNERIRQKSLIESFAKA